MKGMRFFIWMIFVYLVELIACAPAPTPAPPTLSPTLAPTTILSTLTPTVVASATSVSKPTDTPSASATPSPPALQIKQIDTRPGVTLRFVFTSPSSATTAVIMFPGGDGTNMFQATGDSVKFGGNFLVRTTPIFVQQGFAATVLDVSSDQKSGMAPAFRTSAQHAQDVSKLLDYLDSQGFKSVYLLGTSNGTISVQYLGGALNDARIKGIVSTSTITGAPGHLVTNAFNSIPLAKIAVPVLYVHHHDDQCPDAQFAPVMQLPKKLTASPKVDVIEVNGGSPPQSGPCDPFAQHGYFGIEKPVVQAIADWINGKPVPNKIGP